MNQEVLKALVSNLSENEVQWMEGAEKINHRHYRQSL